MALRSLLFLLSLALCSLAEAQHEEAVSAHLNPRGPPSGTQLSVLCVGDSITVGVGDGYPILKNENNGYRLDLYELFGRAGWDVQFIGTQSSGTNNPQPRMEGYGGQTIKTVHGYIQDNGILRQQPNLILLHIGTNDNDIDTTDEPVAGAASRLASMIDYILCSDPNAVLLVAMIIQDNYQDKQKYTDAYNAQIPGLVGDRYKKGYKIRAVDMSSIGGSELSDILHPDATGYQDMANRWYEAIANIPDSWWSKANPSGPAFGGPLETCARDAISFTPAIGGNLVATGAHVDSDPGEPLSSGSGGNTFSPGWRDDNVVAIGTGNPGPGVQFADLNGDGLSDYLWINYTDGSVRGWLNVPPNGWQGLNNGDLIAFGLPGATFAEFADLNGDKRAEYIVVADGAFRVFRNDGLNGNVVLWSELVLAGQQLTNIFGGTAGFHYFADMNGDGYADLIVYNANSVLDIYFNTGPSGDGFGWSPCLGKGIAAPQMWFVDIDGDGRADYMSMDPDGGVSGWLNKPGGTCDISWVAINDRKPKSVALGTGAPAGRVRLADLDGDHKADYLVIDDDIGSIHKYTNIGTNHAPDVPMLGGYAAGVRLHDLDGDGRDDYLSVTDYTGILAFLNGGQNGDSSWTFNVQENGNVVALGYSGAKRYMIQFADLNGDGRDDYIVVDDTTGQVHCYLNLGPSSTSNWLWNIMQPVIAIADLGVRFADYDGDGRADYIVLDEQGSAKIYLNTGPGDTVTNWKPVNNGLVAALGVGAQREDVRLFDVDGDGKFDYLWVHPDTGAVDVWYNIYDGTTPGWLNGGQLIAGQGYPGRNILFGRIGTTGRGDYVALDEATGAFRAWINQCSNVLKTETRQISGACGAPPLPSQSTTEPGPTPRPTIVSVDQGGHTVIQGTDGVPLTLPTGVHTPLTLTEPNGAVITYTPIGGIELTTTDSSGQTVISNSNGVVTVPTGQNSPVTLTEPNGVVTTFTPSPPAITTTDSSGHTVISDSSGQITLPLGITAPTTTTNAAGVPFTFLPSTTTSTTSSSSAPLGLLFPYFGGEIDSSTSDGENSLFTCRVWFLICISWIDIRIGGWYINLPTGIRPPGPPPTITFPPIPHVSIRTIGPLPDWPQISIDPQRTPHYDDNPPKDCKTQTGQICITSTSFGVSGTVTTASQTLSTCETIFGCQATNTAITTAQTDGCTSLTTSSACIVTCLVTVTYNKISGVETNCQTSTCTSTTSGCSLDSVTGSTSSSVLYVCPRNTVTTSTTAATTLTGLPTLTSTVAYCTQTQCNGQQLLVPKSGDCPSQSTCTTSSTATPSPTINVNQGILTCADESSYPYSEGQVEDGIGKFCFNMTNNDPPIVFKPGTSVFKSGLYVPPNDVNNPIRFSAKWTVDDPGCPTTDMSASGAAALCADRVDTIYNNCDNPGVGPQPKHGGKFFRDCITWEYISNDSPVDI